MRRRELDTINLCKAYKSKPTLQRRTHGAVGELHGCLWKRFVSSDPNLHQFQTLHSCLILIQIRRESNSSWRAKYLGERSDTESANGSQGMQGKLDALASPEMFRLQRPFQELDGLHQAHLNWFKRSWRFLWTSESDPFQPDDPQKCFKRKSSRVSTSCVDWLTACRVYFAALPLTHCTLVLQTACLPP